MAVFSRPIYAPTMMTWPNFDPGKMVHKIDILKPTQGWDESGPVVIWAPFISNCWASIEPMRGTDIVHSGQVTTQQFSTVTIRYQPGIRASYRINSRKGNLVVVQVVQNEIERDVFLSILCLELGDPDTA